MTPLRIWTAGHSTRSIGEFTDLLEAHEIARIADVRRHPVSRRHPQFGQAALTAGLAERGIGYQHWPELGGMCSPRPDSPHTALKDPAFQGYADHMESGEFARALADVMEWAAHASTALLCAEADPSHCHRRLLSDALTVAGVTVEHLLDPKTREKHGLPRYLHIDGRRLIYDGGVLPIDFG